MLHFTAKMPRKMPKAYFPTASYLPIPAAQLVAFRLNRCCMLSALILAARMKSFSVNPPAQCISCQKLILNVQQTIQTNWSLVMASPYRLHASISLLLHCSIQQDEGLDDDLQHKHYCCSSTLETFHLTQIQMKYSYMQTAMHQKTKQASNTFCFCNISYELKHFQSFCEGLNFP